MKKIITLVALLVATTTSAQSLQSSHKPIDLHLDQSQLQLSKPRYNDRSGSIGLGLISGGALFMTAGFLTVPDYETQPNGTTTTKPFFRQGARMLSIVTGSALFVTGIVVTIGR